MSHRQAYFSSRAPDAASPTLGPTALAALGELYTGEDALKVDAVEGLGMVASRTVDGFTHTLVGPFDGLLGIELWDAPHWRAEGDEVEEVSRLQPAPPDISGLPFDVMAAVLDAALGDEPVVIVAETDRAAWIAWVSLALPRADAERLTFTTFASHPVGVRLTATTPEHAN